VDAWVVISAPREVLEWFSAQPTPAFALFGRRSRVNITGIGQDSATAMLTAVQRLIALSHQRIVILKRDSGLITGPGLSARAALEEMERHGLPTGSYHLPDWEQIPKGLRQVLDSLFKITPPSALIIDGAFLFHAAKEHLGQMGILSPIHVSLICIDAYPTFEWCEPSVAHIQWDSRPWVSRIVRWAYKVSRCKKTCARVTPRRSSLMVEQWGLLLDLIFLVELLFLRKCLKLLTLLDQYFRLR
jgi:DNA-binding LacI/PurR family transcriptional regulator